MQNQETAQIETCITYKN